MEALSGISNAHKVRVRKGQAGVGSTKEQREEQLYLLAHCMRFCSENSCCTRSILVSGSCLRDLGHARREWVVWVGSRDSAGKRGVLQQCVASSLCFIYFPFSLSSLYICVSWPV